MAKKPVAKVQTPNNSPGVVVLQWLTYAFWGWLILGLIWLMSVILINAILGDPVDSAVPYAIAATIVLLPLAFVGDFFYRKHEPTKKEGAAMVIMVIHAVIFALLGIGSLVVGVFMGINMAINVSRATDEQTVALLVAFFAAVLYAGAFLRTLNPTKAKTATRIYGVSMLVLTVGLLIAAFVGPLAKSAETRYDRLIEENLQSVQMSVDAYISSNDQLPTSLSDVSFSRDAQLLVDDNRVEYTPVDGNVTTELGGKAFHYELCVEYQQQRNKDEVHNQINKNEFTSDYLDTYAHDAGRTCYKREFSSAKFNEFN